jgi:hypothetical protein
MRLTSHATSTARPPSRIIHLCIALIATASTAQAASPLIDIADYFDDFAVTGPQGSAAGPANPRPDGFFGNNDNGAYNVKVNNLANGAFYAPAGRGNSFDVFSFNTPTSQFDARPGNASGDPGKADGFAQSGGNDNVIAYGARQRYVVSVDAILPNDRLDISSGTDANGGGIFTPGSLSVFFRKSPAGIFGGTSIDIFKPDPAAPNGLIQTAAPVGHTVSDDNFHNWAVDFDQAGNRLKIYVDYVLTNDLDLTTFAGGVYANFSNASIGFGGNGAGAGFASYADNFTVGTPAIPEPAALSIIGLATIVAMSRRTRD